MVWFYPCLESVGSYGPVQDLSCGSITLGVNSIMITFKKKTSGNTMVCPYLQRSPLNASRNFSLYDHEHLQMCCIVSFISWYLYIWERSASNPHRMWSHGKGRNSFQSIKFVNDPCSKSLWVWHQFAMGVGHKSFKLIFWYSNCQAVTQAASHLDILFEIIG